MIYPKKISRKARRIGDKNNQVGSVSHNFSFPFSQLVRQAKILTITINEIDQ